MAAWIDNTVLVIVDIDVRGPTVEDFEDTNETDLGGGLVTVNVEDSGYLVNLKAMQEQCPAGDDANVAY